MTELDSILDRYRRHLRLSRDWLLHSIRESGGSAAHFSPVLGWSRAYPETSGYIMTTLLGLESRLQDGQSAAAAERIGDWLVDIQGPEGCWKGGLHPYATGATPSIFNTGQILNGLVAHQRRTGSDRFAAAARRAANWLAEGVGADGVWTSGHYQGYQPDYYTFLAWPMLDHAAFSGDAAVREAAVRVLHAIGRNRQPNGAFTYWAFKPEDPAFTHTIAYTLQGLLESARLLGGDAEVSALAAPAMERLRRQAELSNGRLPGRYDLQWKADKSFECLTGSAQVAICLLLQHQAQPDLRLVNAAAKLVDRVCSLQPSGPVKALRGAVAGSKPLWGAYMRMRYPNWAVKFHADAVMMLMDALNAERTRA